MANFYLTVQRLWRDRRGQDLVEYALLAGSISMTTAAFLPQWVGPTISAIMSKVTSCMANTAG